MADGYHARTDGLTSLAVVAGAIGVWLGFPLADPIIGLLITIAIFGIVWQSAKSVLTRMLDGVEPGLPYGASLTVFDAYLANGQRTFMETCWLPALERHSIDVFIAAMTVASPGCAVFTHEFRALPPAYLRRPLPSDFEATMSSQWVRATLRAFDAMALPGGYPQPPCWGRCEPCGAKLWL